MTFRYLALALIMLTGCTQQETFDPEETKQEVTIWLDGFADAFNAGDWETAVSYYADEPDFYWIERGGLQYDSVESARESLNALATSGLNINVKYTERHISLLGPDAAIASLKFETEFRHADGGKFAFNGWQTTGIVRTNEGWKIAAGHTEALPN